jgi:RPA family protein
MMEKARRRPGIEKAISEISENDFRVRVLGNIVSLDEESSTCEVDDGTAKAVAFFENDKQIESMESGKLVRIIGKVRKNNDNGNETEIDVEIVQDMSEFDLELMKITNDVIEKLR